MNIILWGEGVKTASHYIWEFLKKIPCKCYGWPSFGLCRGALIVMLSAHYAAPHVQGSRPLTPALLSNSLPQTPVPMQHTHPHHSKGQTNQTKWNNPKYYDFLLQIICDPCYSLPFTPFPSNTSLSVYHERLSIPSSTALTLSSFKIAATNFATRLIRFSDPFVSWGT